MSRPIEPTPVLYGEDALRFLEKLLFNEDNKEVVNLQEEVNITRKRKLERDKN